MLEIRIDERSIDFVEKLPAKHAAQISHRIVRLASNPYPAGSKTLKGFPFHRVASGAYRIIYRVEDKLLHVYVIGKRNDDEVYRLLKRLER